SVEQRPVAEVGIDVLGDVQAQELREAVVRHAYREAVQKDLVPARDDRLGNLRADGSDRPFLGRVESSQVRAGERRRDIQLASRAEAETGEPSRERGSSERRILQRHDHSSANYTLPSSLGQVRKSLADSMARALDDAPRS